MIVRREDFAPILRELKECKRIAVDCESTGLRPYDGDQPFSVIVAPSAERAFYFNFNRADDVPEDALLFQSHADGLKRLFSDPTKQCYLHNAKFDMAMLETIGIEMSGKIHDTMTTARLLDNVAPSISLAACAEKIGHAKDMTVDEYIKKKKLYTDTTYRGKEVRLLHYDKVPFDMIVPYAETDTKITFALAEHQKQILSGKSKAFQALYQNEFHLLRTVYEMEKRGVKINHEYCEKAIAFESSELQRSANEFTALTQREFKDSPDLFLEVFKDENITFKPETKTGQRNPNFDSYALESFQSPLAQHVLNYRTIKKRLEFYENFLFYADPDGILHAGFNQAGTITGRFSAWEPNLQQLKKDEGDDLNQEFVVRRAIVPRDGFMFLMLDYSQVEYRLMLDQAMAHILIKRINEEGVDVHQAMADQVGITRSEAKTVNFGIIYGIGIAKLAKKLGCSEDRARQIKYAVLNADPAINKFIRTIMGKAKSQGLLINWFGRECQFPDPQFAYRGPNHVVQGGAADIMKIAMNRVRNHLLEYQSKVVMTIHDELVIELHEKEKYLAPKLRKIMEEVYRPIAGLPMACTVEYSRENLADKKKLGDNDI